jgi:hypothetical protein
MSPLSTLPNGKRIFSFFLNSPHQPGIQLSEWHRFLGGNEPPLTKTLTKSAGITTNTAMSSTVVAGTLEAEDDIAALQFLRESSSRILEDN